MSRSVFWSRAPVSHPPRYGPSQRLLPSPSIAVRDSGPVSDGEGHPGRWALPMTTKQGWVVLDRVSSPDLRRHRSNGSLPPRIEMGSPIHVEEHHAGDRDVLMMSVAARFRTNARCARQ
jgi:hypothetical protein